MLSITRSIKVNVVVYLRMTRTLFCWAWQVGFQAIAEALGSAAVKAVVAISAIIAGGRLVRIMLAFLPALCVSEIT